MLKLTKVHSLKFDNYGEKANEYYEQKIIDEKILKIKFNFKCYSTCETCEYAGFNITNQKCLSCKNSNIFCLIENEGNCYNINNLSSQYSYYLDSKNGNQMICIPSDEAEETDEDYSVDETNKNDRNEEIEEDEESDRTEETERIDRAEEEADGKYETTDENNENEEIEISEENDGIDDINKEFNYDDIIKKKIMISNDPESYIKIIDIII